MSRGLATALVSLALAAALSARAASEATRTVTETVTTATETVTATEILSHQSAEARCKAVVALVDVFGEPD